VRPVKNAADTMLAHNGLTGSCMRRIGIHLLLYQCLGTLLEV
jgi:hypothetical protein